MSHCFIRAFEQAEAVVAWDHHLADCSQCRENLFGLCPRGFDLFHGTRRSLRCECAECRASVQNLNSNG